MRWPRAVFLALPAALGSLMLGPDASADPAAARRVRDIAPGAASSTPSPIVAVGAGVSFAADDGTHGRELWRSDGTEAGTVLVKDIAEGPASSNPTELLSSRGTLFFNACTPAEGCELWRSDGTAAGTTLVRDIRPGPDSSVPINLAEVAGKVLFFADDGTHGWELWGSDGTEAGTALVKDIDPAGTNPTAQVPSWRQLWSQGGVGYFSTYDGTRVSLWKTDGTEAGTSFLKAVNEPRSFALAGSTVFFRVLQRVETFLGEIWGLWKTDGTTAGTVRVDGPESSLEGFKFMTGPTAVGSLVFLGSEPGGNAPPASERGLFRSDGTAAGTTRVRGFEPGSCVGRWCFPGVGEGADLDGTLVFSRQRGVADDGSYASMERDLWRSDGTEAGTVLLKRFGTGDAVTAPSGLVVANGVVYFAAGDASLGSELWSSDGTGDGTLLRADVAPGAASSAPASLTATSAGLFFSADDGASGRELWLLPFPALVAEDRTVVQGGCANAAFRIRLSFPTPYTVSVPWATEDETAIAGTDYTASSGTLTLTPGRQFHSVYVPILAGGPLASARTFRVVLGRPTAAVLDRGVAIGTIEPAPVPEAVPMYRAYNFTADYHFFTTSAFEKDNAVANGYRDESDPIPFRVPNVLLAGSSALFRMYNPNTGRHYYTASAGERDALMGLGFVYEKDEGFIFSSPESGTTEVFRMYNRNSGTHLYTKSAAEKDHLLATFPGIWEQHQSLGWALP